MSTWVVRTKEDQKLGNFIYNQKIYHVVLVKFVLVINQLIYPKHLYPQKVKGSKAIFLATLTIVKFFFLHDLSEFS